MAGFEELEGKIFTDVFVSNDRIYFFANYGFSYALFHDQDCCEHVFIESIDGDIATNLPGKRIIEAREAYNSDNKPPEGGPHDDSYTWSFYTIRTERDTFTIRFFGSSNGYYGETATLYRLQSVSLGDGTIS